MKIDIIGRGNVGWHLLRAFDGTADTVVVNPHTLERLRPDADLYLICVSDNAIPDLATALAGDLPRDSVVAHTSGTTDIKAVSDVFTKAGVFYPLQTFTKGVELDYHEIPVMLEYTDDSTRHILEHAAGLISGNVMHVDSPGRANYHIASVFSCNFVNHMWTLAAEYLTAHNLDFSTLVPLIRETARKIERESPSEAQTGPACRHDGITLARHLDMLDSDLLYGMRDIYRILSDSIADHHPKT